MGILVASITIKIWQNDNKW